MQFNERVSKNLKELEYESSKFAGGNPATFAITY